MVKKIKKLPVILTALALSVAVLLAVVPFDSVFATAAESKTEIEALKKAWQDLRKLNTELLVTPNTTDSACKKTADSTELTDEEKAAFGDCYYHITSGGERGFTAAGGSFKDYSDKENVKYSFSYKLIFSGGGSNFEVKFFDTSWNVGSIWPYTSEKNKLKTITSGAGNIGGKDVRKTYGVIVNPNGNEVYIGGIYVTYDAPLGMEESFKGNSLRKLVKAAKQLDLSAVSNEAAEAFKSAIAAAENAIKPITVNETKYRKTRQNLISAWQKLTYEDRELWAIPNEKYLKETTEEQAQRFGLTAEALGECYAYVDLKALPDNTLQFFAFDGSKYFDSLKGAAKLKVAYSFIDDTGKPVTGDGGVIDLQFNAKDSTYPNSWVHSYSISGSSENFAGYFNGTEDVTYAKAFMNSGSKYNKIAIGGIYKITVKNEQLPYGYKNMELPVLLEYAARLDLSKYETASAANFSAVLENAKLMSNMYILSKCDSLTFTAKDGGVEFDADLGYKELITSAMNVNLSKAGNKKEILNALWMLRLCTADGAAIENLKVVWEKTENSLPENYARLSVKQWIAAGDNIGKISNQALNFEFAEELKQLKYYSTGVPEIATLKKYVAEAQKMNKNDFNALSWSNFNKVLIYAKKIVKTPSDYSQIYSDETLEKLLSVWGKLKYFSRTLYVDFSDYYQANPDVSVSLNPQDSRNTYAELVKNIKLDNGVDRAVKVVNLHPEDGVLWFAGKKLMSLNGYSSFEFYINLEKMDIKSGNGTLAIQLMNKDGTEWFDYYLHFSKSGVGNGWQRVVVPISSMINYKNGKRQSGIYMNENGFIVNGINFRLENSSGTFSISNIVALKECYAKAGVVPVIEPIAIYREPEKVKVIPKNPFTGLDRGDPWGDEYRATIKKDVIKKNPVNKTPVKDTDSVNYYILGAVLLLVILAAAGAVLVIVLKKRTAHRQ